MKTITEILNIGSMDQINKDLFENVKQYGEQDNNNDSPRNVKSNCSSNGSSNSSTNGEGTHKNKTSEGQLRAIKRYQEKNKQKIKENKKQYYEDNKEYFKQYSLNYYYNKLLQQEQNASLKILI